MSPDDSAPAEGSETDEDTATQRSYAGGDLLEAIIMVLSALLILGVLGYLVSQAIVTPTAAEPTATVETVEPFRSDESGTETVRVRVSLVNEGGTGLEAVEVVVHCGATERSLVFTQVPADGNRMGTVICPEGTTSTASVVAWIEG